MTVLTTNHARRNIRRPLTSPISTVVIGGGKISEQHLRTLQRINDVTITGVCDLSPALARFAAERFGIGRWYTDYREMLADAQVDVVHVLTPPGTHDRIVRECLDRGCHVIVEKPIALSNQNFRELWELAEMRGLMLFENHNYLFNEPIRRLSSAIAEGCIGEVDEVEVRMALGIRTGGRYADRNLPHPSHQLPAGVIHEFITHLSYLLLHFMGRTDHDAEPFDTVRAIWRNQGGDDLFKYDDLDASVDAGPVRGRIRFTCRQWPECLAVQVRGSEGVAMAEVFHPVVRIVRRRGVGQHLTPLVNALSEAKAMRRSAFGSVWRKVRNRTAYEGLDHMLRRTYMALRGQCERPIGFRQMDQTTRLIDAMLDVENQV